MFLDHSNCLHQFQHLQAWYIPRHESVPKCLVVERFLEEAPACFNFSILRLWRIPTRKWLPVPCLALLTLGFPIWKQLSPHVTFFMFGSFVQEINHIRKVGIKFFSLHMSLHEINSLHQIHRSSILIGSYTKGTATSRSTILQSWPVHRWTQLSV